jgi:hypothetical protein
MVMNSQPDYSVSGVSIQLSRRQKTAGLIEKETNEHRILNVQPRTSNNVFGLFNFLTGSTGLRKKSFAPAGWINRIVSCSAKKDPVNPKSV